MLHSVGEHELQKELPKTAVRKTDETFPLYLVETRTLEDSFWSDLIQMHEATTQHPLETHHQVITYFQSSWNYTALTISLDHRAARVLMN